MSVYSAALRPLLFGLSPDASHTLAQAALRWAPPWRLLGVLQGLRVDDPRLRTRFAGLELPGPVGLAAGFDKNCVLIEALSCLGFGFLTVGSVMPEPRFGNPFPRLVRYPETGSLADSMGVPSKGREYAVEQLAHLRRRSVPLIANIGGFSATELANGFFDVEPHVDAVEISLMCPNVLAPGEHFDELAVLADLLDRIEARRKPTIVRVPNDTTQVPDRLAELIERCIAGGVAGIKIGGGRRIPESRLGTHQGTLHGGAIREAALANVEAAARIARGRISIKGNGGIRTAADVLAMLRAGACCVDLYSAFIYEGWTLARDIHTDLLRALGGASVQSINTATAATAGAAHA
ncbi:MAG: dihydroorotate dehydrogenase 2 [Betaproteobacteria bacterium]